MARDLEVLQLHIAKLEPKKGDLIVVKLPAGLSRQERDNVTRSIEAVRETLEKQGILKGVALITSDYDIVHVAAPGGA